MTDNRTTGLRVMLNRLIREVDRLDIALDAPASNMTLGEYEQAREKLLDGFTQTIAATLGVGECEIAHRNGDWHCTGCNEMVGSDDPWNELFVNGNAVELWRYCPNCGRKVKR